MNTSTARLVVHQGQASQQEYRLTERTMILGREVGTDIVLYDPEVSRRHAKIDVISGRFVIEDLGSTNGTFVNGRRITSPKPLNDGDVIDMGESIKLSFHKSVDADGDTLLEMAPDPAKKRTVVERPPQAMRQRETPPFVTQPDRQATTPPAVSWQDAPSQVDQDESQPSPAQERANRRRVFIGCGCLLFLSVVACASFVFLLDAYRPDALYCGPLQPLFNLLGFTCP